MFFFFFFLLVLLLPYANGDPLLEDANALASLRNGLHSPTPVLDTWNISDPSSVCTWSGVSCERRRVAALDLSNLNISGKVSLAGLDALVNLSLAGNQLTEPIKFAGRLPCLRHLNISANQLSGDITWDFARVLPSLEVLDAYDNNFTAPLPVGVLNLTRLRYLDLGGNFFYGEIPVNYGKMLALEYLSLTGNDLRGRIPGELGNLTGLKYLYLGYFNSFSGGIPPELGKLVNLVQLDLSKCGLNGVIPGELGNLVHLDTLYLHTNLLAGTIPATIGNLINLAYLDLSNNALTGEIPREFAALTNLNLFNLFMNRLHGSIPEFVADLPELETMELFMNNFTGVIPARLGSHGRLRLLDLSSNKLTGTIPEGLCSSNQLKILILFKNFLFGPLPESLGKCSSLTRVRLAQNYLNGSIPFGLLYLPHLDLLELHNNYLSGSISEDSNPDRREARLGVLNLSNNLLSGSIPSSISNLSSLETLLLNENRFSGEIPASVGGLRRLTKLDLRTNTISGAIPPEIGQCSLLTYLDLSQNQLSGAIPQEITALSVLSYLNLSRNHLSQSIPRSIGSIASLTAADFSFNDLSGRLPDSSGQLAFLNSSAFAGNPRLCGGATSNPCGPSASTPAPPPLPHRLPANFKLVFALGLLLCSLVFAAAAAAKARAFRLVSGGNGGRWKMTSFQKVGFEVTEVVESMKEGNEIGKGGSGVVYLCRLPSGSAIAVKRLMGFTAGDSDGHDHGFRAEIRTLGSIRHRNIVRLLAFCSDSRTNALVYEFMSNGSLGEALHGKGGGFLGWARRYRIALEAARGLCYLHHDCSPMIVHRDVKSNNILLDANFEAHVADFGLAKFLRDGGASECMSAVAGSYGYIAPEYAYTLKVDEKSDVYSFGVVLLELITGRRPVGDFGDGVDIVQWVKKMTDGGKEHVDVILDSRLGTVPMDEAMHIFFVAVLCIGETSVERPTMREVVQMLSEFNHRHGSGESSPSSLIMKPEEKGKASPHGNNCYKLFPDLLS
ncbi:Leucine-rich repeat receptor-like serine/threonine-protein kinase BAM2 [Apostasia shenzhenica]|uniref:non-specific serine/threonine protein kinase n=1 Tax=Apostasia shenzhenica TaxID=1088818 RepID=A0A2I0ANL5_9ASPA|nr:Leucine-rich repeat receptor-like serine/threonine-protein kinase BAM2 [Apostasia shenzhenica]